ncbi:SDR family NAD(P)-dependent oxidoreductase [Streptomyces sp. bgisy091]|uniref:SDR family NAD(P)-dependent oxidoreductase n=1 Tax=Streptomyces sp. bgisy091 TaxID=3413778 RepID=UPI003D748EA3
MTTPHEPTTGTADHRIAVVGIGCRLPGARDQRQYFANLRAGTGSIREITPERWDPAEFYSPDITAPGRSVSKWCGTVDEPYAFDHGFFQVSPKEARLMDPQQRLLLEETWHCVEDAGIALGALRAARTSVYVGVMGRDHLQLATQPGTQVESHSALGAYDCLLANRISHSLGLRGASLSLDAACASSMVAIHTGSQALLAGETDYVLAGGVSLNLHPWKYISFSKARMLSPDGLCKTFDRDADGYVPGEGAAMVLLRRLDDAVRDGDHIYGVLAGSAVNHGGHRPTITAPTVESQREVISAAFDRAGVEPSTITYVEAHGTGTSLGDPIEVEALRQVFTGDGRCVIGSVKPNIGHLEAAAGVAGLIKVLMMLQTRRIPPSIHLTDPNPLIDFQDGPFRWTTEEIEWAPARRGAPLRAGVSSFGMGGVNSHLIVEEYRPKARRRPARPADALGEHPFLLSARSAESLDLLLDAWRKALAEDGWTDERVADACATLATGREHLPYRVGGVIRTAEDIAALLADTRTGQPRTAEPDWWLRIAACPEPPGRKELGALLRSAPYMSVVDAFTGGSAKAAAAVRALRAGKRGPRETCLFGYLTVRVLLDVAPRPAAVTAAGTGLWPALAAADALDWESALALAEGVEGADVVVRTPRIPFVEPVTGQVLNPVCLDRAYVDGLLDGLAVAAEEKAGVAGRAARLVDGQHTFRAHLDEWNRLLTARGAADWRLPMDGAGLEAAVTGDESGPRALVRVLALQNALDRLHRKWGLPQQRPVRDPRAVELLDLLADGVLTPRALLALVRDGDAERADAVAEAQGAVRRAALDAHGYPILRAHGGVPAALEYAAGWTEAANSASPAAAPEGTVTLTVGDRGEGDDLGIDAIADGAAFAAPLTGLWLRGVPVDWQRYHAGRPLRRLPLPTTEFVRTEHRTVAAPAAQAQTVAPASARLTAMSAAVPTAVPAALSSVASVLADAPGAAPEPRLIEVRSEWVPGDTAGTRAAAGPVLLVVPAGDPRAAAERALPGRKLYVVGFGPAYRRDGDSWTVRPTEEADWHRLVADLAEGGGLPRSVVRLTEDAPGGTLDERLATGPEATFLLTKAAVAARNDEPVLILDVQPHTGTAPAAELHAVAGLAHCLRRESSRVRLRVMTVDHAAGEPALWERIAHELATDAAGDTVVRHRGADREVRRFHEAEITAGESAGVRPGVYLVTGGAGGLGRLVARHLLVTDGVRVALVGRSAQPADLAETGSPDRLAYFRADVTDLGATEAVVRAVRERFGPVTGVIHAAGVLRDGFLVNKSLDDFRAVLAPKVKGAVNLDLATLGEPLDLFLLFSSVVAVAGNLGQADYAVANSFLDGFADERERSRAAGARSGRTLSIGWPLWSGGGMAVPEGTDTVFRAADGLAPMPATVGLAALAHLVSGPAGRRTLVHGTPGSALRLVAGASEGPSSTPSAAAPTGTADQLAVRYVTGLFSQLLEMPESTIDPDLGLDQYGIDSIFISQFNAQVEQDLGPVPQTLLFECRSLAHAAARIAEERATELADRYADGPATVDTPVRALAVPAVAQRAREAHPGGQDIAVIGLAGHYPGAPELGRFWRNLAEGRDSVTEIPRERWDYRERFTQDPEQLLDGGMYCKWGAFLDGVDRFDPLFFSISPRDAELMDPQERLFLQTAWEAFEDAGYPPYRLGDPAVPGDRAVGVFAAVTTQSYLLWGPDQWRAGHRGIPTSTQWSLANRVSYWLDLHGPSMPVDTACASSLSAVHLACESLARGESRLALVGGVNLYLHPSKYDWLCQMQMLTRTGKCHTFGASADGFVPGEGVGAMVLKPLSEAVADGDRVLGVIKGTAVNHGGRTNGFTVPSPRAQAEVIRAALRDAGVDADSIGYLEAHGTGTALGDPIEIAGLTEAFTGTGTGTVAIGSVKTNIGHLESAAGIAGLTKVLLQLRNRQLVPSLNSAPENPRIDFAATPFRVQRTLADWPAGQGPDGLELPRRAGISSFGAGGANAHVIIEEYAGQDAPRGASDGEHLVVLSARNGERLRVHAGRIASGLRSQAPELRVSEVAYQLQVRREPLPERLAVLGSDPVRLAEQLEAYAEGRVPEGAFWSTGTSSTDRAAAREAVPRALAARDLPTLARSWVAGATVRWEAMYSAPLRHVSLPAYPFAQERHWLPDVREAAAAEGVGTGHPFLSETSADGTSFGVEFTGGEFFLDDHRVDGEPIFPAVGYLEMVRAAVASTGRTVLRLRNNVWSAALTVTEPRQVRLALSDTGYQVFSLGADDERIVHGQGLIDLADDGRAEDLGETLDLDALRARLTSKVTADEFYPRIHALGLQLGPSYQGIEQVHMSEDEVLSEIRLPGHLHGSAAPFGLHPCLLDSALQGCLWLIEQRERQGRLHLPFTIGTLDLGTGHTPARCYAHVSVRSWTATAKKVDVRIADEQGRVLVRVRDFWLRPWHTPDPAATPAHAAPVAPVGTVAPVGSAERPSPGAYFRPEWVDAAPPAVDAGPVVLFAPTAAAGRRIASRLGTASCTVVTPGSVFRVTADGGYRVRPDAAEDFTSLIAALGGAGRARDIVFAWPSHRFDADGIDAQLADGLVPLFHLVRALLQASDKSPARIVCVYPAGPEGQPSYQALGGFLRTAGRESSRLTYRMLELPADELVALAEGSGPAADRIAAETGAGHHGATEIRHRGGVRQVRRWGAVAPSEAGASGPLRRGGVYVITGGAGGLGALVARHLARTAAARLVLAGRSAGDERTDALVAEVRRLGGEAVYLSADVATAEGATALVRAAKEAYGRVDGVFHSAGVLRDDYLVRQDLARMEQVIAPKARGVLHLDAATSEEPLDLFCLFSSVAGPLGSAGQAWYAYANSFLDGFAYWREELRGRQVRSGRTVSVNWPLWAEGGMGVDDEVQEWLLATFGLRPLGTPAGLAALEAALAGPAGQVLFTEGEGVKVASQLGAAVAAAPEPSAESGVPMAALRELLVGEVAEIVKLDPARVDPTAQIGDFGFDSLSFNRLANRLNKSLSVEVSPAVFFEYTTVEELVGYLAETYPAELAAHLGAPVAAAPVAAAPVTPTPAAQAAVAQAAAPVAAEAPAPARDHGSAREPIAVIGMHGMMPRSADLDAFWRHLEAGDDLVTEIPSDRWDWREYYSESVDGGNRTNSKWGGFLDDVASFDARFFGISPREAELMDPQQRLFLQTAYKTVEEAGYKPSDLAQGRTGLFVGVATHDYYDLMRQAGVPVEAYTTTGLFHAILANRVSYLLNLKGPSFPIDTACSSSLVAIRSAVEAIWSGSCETAIAGGVNLLLAPMIYISFARAGMLSPDGRCKTFDESANGYVRGEGAGALLLKPLSAAVRDGDHIHAVIRGSAVNHGGRVNTLTTPNPNAQSELIVHAFEEAGVDPATVGYMEMHGTGTALGDPIEVNGLKKAFRELRDRAGLPRLTEPRTLVGSVKSGIGHLEAAAGMAGIFKTILSMKHGKVPGSLHLRNVNPHIQLSGSPLRIVREAEEWPRPTGEDGRELPRRAGVSSFGFGGVNGHVLLEEYLPVPSERPEAEERREHVFVLSARTQERLREYARTLSGAVAAGGSVRGGGAYRDRIASELSEFVAELLDVRPQDVPLDEPLEDLGLGALRLSSLQGRIADRHGLPSGPGHTLAGRSLADLAGELPGGQGGQGGEPVAPLLDIAYTLQLGREAMEHRLAVVCDSAAGLADRLRRFATTGETGRDTEYGTAASGATGSAESDAPRALARHWVRGGSVDWARVYEGRGPRRVSLPTYPFAPTRHWFRTPAAQDDSAAPAPSAAPLVPAAHPLIDGPLTGGTGFRKWLAVSDRMVAEHRIHGRPVFPGVGHIEMAFAALAATRAPRHRLTRVTWLKAVTVDAPGRELAVRLHERDGGRVEYALESEEEDGTTTTFSRGVLEPWEPATTPAPVVLEDIRRRCPLTLDQETVYRRFRDELGIDYGPFFRGLRGALIGEGEVLARVELDPADRAGADAYRLHPTVMDSALQAITVLGFAAPAGTGRTRLPFSLESAELLAPVPAHGYVHVRALDADGFDVAVLDEAGRVCVRLGEVTVREQKDRFDRFFHEPYWSALPALPARSAQAAEPSGGCLIVHAPGSFGLPAELAGRYATAYQVELGSRTRQLGDRAWEIDASDPAAFAAALRGLGEFRHVWFLGGLLDRPAAEPAGRLADRAALGLFRLVKALSETDRVQAAADLRIVVNDVHDVDGRRITNPYAGGLIGLAKTLAKEFPQLAVVCVDICVPAGVTLPSAERTALADALAAEPAQWDGEEIALAGGRRLVKRLRRLELPAPARPVFRRGGTYLIVGGAGGIGLTVAEHLARTAGARLVLVGRSPQSPDVARALTRLADAGGEAVYVAADVTDPAAMRSVIEGAKARFGALHGVFHAAMVLRDGIVERMDDETFRAALAPKAEGSRVLGELLADEPLDFLLLLSSVQSFTGSAGQGNYAAASTAQDACARALAGRAGYPVQVVNWGFWGTVGAVATPEHRTRLAARGFRPIAPEEGMAAVERVLAGERRQVVAMSAEAHVLASIGLRDEDPAAPAAPAPVPVRTLVVTDRDRAEQAEFDAFIAAALLGALQGMGLFRHSGQRHRRAGLTAEAGALPAYRRLMDGLVRVLEAQGLVAVDGEAVTATERIGAAAAGTASLGARAASLRASYPNLDARLDLVVACLAGLPQVLTGAIRAPEVLFPGASTDRVARIYRGEKLTDYCNLLVADEVALRVRAWVDRGRPGGRFRVLEIGAGTGATTRGVLDVLRPMGGEIDYDFTDLSVRFLREAERGLDAGGVRMAFRELDIERPVTEQGFADGAYDVVVAANVLHATRDLDAVLERVRRLLAPAGQAVLTEVTRMLPFHTVTFGLLDGWWYYEDEGRRLPSSPLLDTELWRRRLEHVGFTRVGVLGSGSLPGELSQRVISAEAGVPAPAAVTAPGFTVPAFTEAPVTPAVASAAPVPTAPAASSGAPLAERVAGLVAQLTAECLGMPVEELDRAKPLSSFGVDSIVGVELINRLNEALGVVLKTIVIFDHPTVAALASFIVDRHGPAIEPRFTAQEPVAEPVRALPPPEPAAVADVTPAPAAPLPAPGPAPVPAPVSGLRAVRFERPGTYRDLRIAALDPRDPGAGEIEVAVRAFPVNFSDFLLAKGLYPMMPDFPLTPGVEVSGVVRRVGPGVTRLAVGDEVIALTRPEMGGQASVVLTDENFAVRKPANITHEEACGFPVAFLAMYLAFERAGVRPGERVLIPAATGTNGLVAVQLAQLAGAEIVATAGSQHKIDHLARMGVGDAIDHQRHDVVEEVLRRTGGRGVDVVVNTLGDGATQQGLNVLAPEGRYVEIAVFGLQSSGGLDLSRLVDNQSFQSFNTKKFFLRHPEKRLPYLETMASYLESGKVRPSVARVLPFDRVVEAYEAKEDRAVIGRVVVSVEAPADPGRATAAPTAVARPAAADRGITGRGTDIAVIGMSARFPGAGDVSELWDNLAAGVSSVGAVPADRWAAERFFDPDPTRLDTTYCRSGGFIDGIDRFDAPFFSISGKEAAQTDPQQRLFLEEAWKALEDAGYPASSVDGLDCGVFVGVGPSEYLTRMNKAGTVKEAQSFWGNEASVLAARISYFLNLKGPSIAVNTACSSSLVALHLACRSLIAGESGTAIAGGSFLTLAPDYFVVASNGNMLSPEGRCKSFDDSADGFGPGEGVGAIVLKPLADALRDGDHVHGVIKGTAINQDGRTNGITAPSGLAQTEVELAAYRQAGVDPSTISLVEAHGTGTPLGDPVEIEALTNAFRTYTDRKQFCAIGSVKTNIGHTAAAAGIAGIIKVLLSFKHRQIPASLNFEKPNRLIDFEESPFYVNTALRDWTPEPGTPRRAAVSSFGFSGTNAHVVLEEPPTVRRSVPAPRPVVAVPLSARTPTALRARTAQLAQWLDGAGAEVSLTEIAYQLQLFRDHFGERTVFLVRTRAELAEALRGTPRTSSTGTTDSLLAGTAERYLAGESVDWAALWEGQSCGRVPMPTYPFDRNRYWYTEQDTVYASPTRPEPEFHRLDAAPGEHRLRTTLTGDELFVRDHLVGDRRILPGVLYPEYAVRAMAAAGLKSGALRDLAWLRPVVASGGPVTLTVRLRSEESGTRFEFTSDGPAGELPHATGLVLPPDGRAVSSWLDLAAVRAACPERITADRHYRTLGAMGLHHGPSLRAVQEIQVGATAALARLRLPGAAHGTLGSFELHPALLDGALQVLGAFSGVAPEDAALPLLPFSLGELTRSGPLPAECHAYVTAKPPARSSDLFRTFDIQLVDDEGHELITLRNLTIKLPEGGRAATRAEEEPQDVLRSLLLRLRGGEIDEAQAEAAMEAYLAE